MTADDGARVVAAHGRHVVIETAERRRLHALLRGKRSELVVGDRVRWSTAGDGAVVEALLPRRNLLYRQDEWRSKSFAANLDALVVLVAGEPMFSESQLARALVAASEADIPAAIVLNKIDRPTAALARERLLPYRAMGVAVHEVALKGDPPAARAELEPLLRGRATLILGPSGSGKSTLINAFVPAAQAQVGEISKALGTGRHTTTTTTWYDLGASASDGALIDSPGFQSFGLQQVPARDLARHMPDLAAQLGGCRFHDCTHRHEPGCALIAAAERGDIAPSRWRLYGELFDELDAPPRY